MKKKYIYIYAYVRTIVQVESCVVENVAYGTNASIDRLSFVANYGSKFLIFLSPFETRLYLSWWKGSFRSSDENRKPKKDLIEIYFTTQFVSTRSSSRLP